MSVRVYCDDGHERQPSYVATFTKLAGGRWQGAPEGVIETRTVGAGAYERVELTCPHPRCRRNVRARVARLGPVLDRLEDSMWGGSGILSYKGISLRRLAATLESK